MTIAQIDEIVRLYGQFDQGLMQPHAIGRLDAGPRSNDAQVARSAVARSKVFDNADFGYTRVTIERPLRLRYQMTTDDKARFLDACPHLLGDVQAIDQLLGREPRLDWPATWDEIEALLKKRGSRWKATEQKLFRSVFTQRDAKAKAVALPSPARGRGAGGEGGDEADADLRDFENVPLTEDVDAYFEREVKPHVPDAWMDRAKDKVGYEINFNRHFYVFTPPRALADIDRDLKAAEDHIVCLLKDLTT
jgi:type I restriction enzyme M protein